MKRCAMLFFAVALAAAASAAPATAQEATSFSAGGSLATQPYAAYAGSGAFSASDFLYGCVTTLGLDLEAKGDRARAEASLETAVLSGFAARTAWAVAGTAVAGTAVAGSPFARQDELLLPAYAATASAPETAVAARIRTLYLKLDLGGPSLIAGRQVVNYGRGALWSPTDIFTELDLSGLSPERRGTDALRLAAPFGATEALDLVAAPASSPGDGRYALRLRGLAAGVDGALMAARDGAGRGTVLGADFKADLELGFYGEGTCEFYDSGRVATFKAAGGADYSFGDFIVAAEYYYNGGGAASDLLFPGSHNVFGSLIWKASELFSLSGTLVWDLSDESGTCTLLASESVAQNATLGAFLQYGFGQSSYGLGLGPGSSSWSAEAGLDIEVKF